MSDGIAYTREDYKRIGINSVLNNLDLVLRSLVDHVTLNRHSKKALLLSVEHGTFAIQSAAHDLMLIEQKWSEHNGNDTQEPTSQDHPEAGAGGGDAEDFAPPPQPSRADH